MSAPAIRVDGLWKEYVIGTDTTVSSFREAVVDSLAAPWRRLKGRRSPVQTEQRFWALQDISFEVQPGEVVGIIGRNGAGKSTLLKILSRITAPTRGEVQIRGRIASLLEVGTGFHPELTGRENIRLNGAVLGMSQAEVRAKFDEIVAFAGVEKFIDTPVKRYSSGMYVRLAFAVAAHLEPEILVIDEVLAVGDAEFQRKCLGKMGEVAKGGRTVLFVSHQLAAVQNLCTQGVLLDRGNMAGVGDIASIIRQYTDAASSRSTRKFETNPDKPSLCGVRVDADALKVGDLVVEIAFASPFPLDRAIGGIALRAPTGEVVWGSNGRFHRAQAQPVGLASGVLRCTARGLPLNPGTYALSAWLGQWHGDFDQQLDAMSVTIGDAQGENNLRPSAAYVGYMDWPAEWSVSGSQGATNTRAPDVERN